MRCDSQREARHRQTGAPHQRVGRQRGGGTLLDLARALHAEQRQGP
jgi:hypothetical protein